MMTMGVISKIKGFFTSKRILRLIWISFLCFWLGLFTWVKAVQNNWFSWFGEIPGFEILENPKSELASILYYSDNSYFDKYYATNRTKCSYHEISKKVFMALIATEDERYEKHSGIDQRATFRVIGGVLTGNGAGGGSTVTQQLAKNLFAMRRDSIYRGSLYDVSGLNMLVIKTKEWITASRLEKQYTKEEIITMYLNTVNFGYVKGVAINGINEASKTYFNKSPSELNIQEAAVLIGMLKGPSIFSPVLKYENAVQRRNVVLLQLHKAGFIETEEEKKELQALPIELNLQGTDYNSGSATYFRSVLRKELNVILKDKPYDLLRDGLKIYTTIDPQLQDHAEAAVAEHMSELQATFRKSWRSRTPWSKDYILTQLKKTSTYKSIAQEYSKDSVDIVIHQPRKRRIFTWKGETDTLISPYDEIAHNKWMLRSALLSIDPHSGAIKAWVGGISQKHYAYDMVKQGGRQPGSTFKPVLYSFAISNGYSPCTEVTNGPVSIKLPDGKVWQPRAKPDGQMIPIKLALARSINNIAANLMRDVGPKNVVNWAGNLGINKRKLDPVLSLALGVCDVSLFEMVGPYQTFVNHGEYIKPHGITRIEDKYGKVIYRSRPEKHKAMSPVNAYKMVSMLRGSVLEKGGTARRLDFQFKLLKNHNQIGGKTGTTQGSTDGWFMGVTEDLVTGVWVGGEDRNVHFPSGNINGQGARMALPIFGKYMTKAYSDRKTGIKPKPFTVPVEITPSIIASDIQCIEDTSSSNVLIY